MKTLELLQAVENTKARSAWDKGVKVYAAELLEKAVDFGYPEVSDLGDLKKTVLNGAKDWRQYAEGGCSLVYDEDIAKRLCAPSELKKTKNRHNWINVEASALWQAFRLIEETYIKSNR